jgi:hypothetical protein
MRITILAYGKEEFLKRLAKIQKKLKIEVVSEKTRTEVVEEPVCSEFTEEFQVALTQYRKVTYHYLDYELECELENYKVQGFKFLGMLSMDDAGAKQLYSADENLFGKVDDTFDFSCFHCNRNIPTRSRRFFFLREADGEIVSIGSTCAKDYFGFDICRDLAKGLDWMRQLRESADEYCGGRYRVRYSHYNDIVRFSIYAWKTGVQYISKSRADVKMTSSTSSRIADIVYDSSPAAANRRKLVEAAGMSEEEVQAEMEKIEKFYEGLEPQSDFHYNLKAQFADKGDTVALLVYGVYNYYWHLEAEKSKNITYFDGDVLQGIEVLCTRVHKYDNQWGGGRVITFLNCTNEFVFFTAGNFDVEQGDKVLIKRATVGGRKEYNGRKQTIIRTTAKGLVNLSKEE